MLNDIKNRLKSGLKELNQVKVEITPQININNYKSQ